jgi:GTPase SAR1 family protein
MSKKIIFVGPPGAGKTTLRKIFFEGENSTKLLEYALEPTYGEESLILRLPGLKEDVGIFDLAGQENQRWLETDEKAIFNGAKVILIITDITAEFDEIFEFVRKVIELRNSLTPESLIYVLLHKIDLVSEKRIRDAKYTIKNQFSNDSLIKFLFTSLKRKFFTKTFTYFMDIMRTCMQDDACEEDMLFNIIEESLKIVHEIDKEVILPRNTLHEKLNRPEKLVMYIVESLLNKGHIEVNLVEDKELLSLTDKGKKIYKSFFESFTSGILDGTDRMHLLLEMLSNEKLPPFFGALIADKDGKSLLKFELFDNALEKYIKNSVPTDGSTIPLDLELIPMFISALEKFSLELNIQNLSGFGLKGSNLKMEICGFEDYTVTIFMNPDINFEPIEDKINNFFRNLFEDYKKEFEIGANTGNIDALIPLQENGKEWLNTLNKTYEEMTINSEIFDDENAKVLYSEIDELYDDIKKEFSITLEKIKKLKVDIMKSSLEKDYDELKKIAKIAQGLKAKYAA